MHRKKIYTAIISSLLVCVLGAARPQNLQLTLAECEDLALQNHQEVRDAELKLQTAIVKKSQASQARILPKFDLRNVWGPIPQKRFVLDEHGLPTSPDTSTNLSDIRYFTDLELNLVQPIYTFGKLSGLNEAAAFGIQVEEANLQNKKISVRAQVRELYWGLLLGKELLFVVEEVRSEVEKADEKIQAKLDEGSEDVSQTDLFKLQIFNYEINKRHRQVVDKIRLAKSALRTLLNPDETVDFNIAAEYLDPITVDIDSLPAYLNIAAQNRPEVAQLQAGMNARQALVRVSKSDYYPQFFFAGQIKYNFAKDRDDPKNPFLNNPTNFFRPGFVVGANMNLNFWQTRNKVRLAQIEYRRLSEQKPLLDNGIRLEVEKAYLAVREADINLRESRRALKASKNWLRSATMTFDLGIGEIKDLIDAFKANSAMQSEYFQNIFQYNTAIAKLSKAIGKDLYPTKE